MRYQTEESFSAIFQPLKILHIERRKKASLEEKKKKKQLQQ